MLVLTAITAVQRFVKVWKQASVDVPLPPNRQRRTPRRQRAAEPQWRQRMQARKAARNS